MKGIVKKLTLSGPAFVLFVLLGSTLLFAQQNGPGPGGANTTALTNFETGAFAGSGICAFCHSNLFDSAGNDVSNDAHWRSTMMANSAKDPLWQAKIESETNRNPHLQTAIEGKCARCHTGMARYQATIDGTEVSVLDTGFLDRNHYLHEAAMDGVSCTLCHQILPDNLGNEDSFTGGYLIDSIALRPDRLIFGPYVSPLINPMRNNTGFIPTSGTQVKNSAHCGSCHTLYTPTVDSSGVIVGEFPEQMTYLEWEHSGFDKSCQDCHMPKASGPVAISNRPNMLPPRDPFGQHHFVGGNSFMVNILKTYGADLGITADAVHLDKTIAETLIQLQQNSGKVTASGAIEGKLLKSTVVVSNLAGHKFPTGFPSRRTWLHFKVTNKRGQTIFESGKPLADGRIEENDADMDGTKFEPHYDSITDKSQVQLYEAVMLNTPEKAVTWTLLSAASYGKDNRLLPDGFDKDSSANDISVKGNAETDANFVGGQDQISYIVDLANAKGPFTVSVELLFQSVSYPFMANLREDDTALVNRFVSHYDSADKMPVVLDSDQIVLK